MRKPDYLDALISVSGWWREHVRREPERRLQREIRARHRRDGGIKLPALDVYQARVADGLSMSHLRYQVLLAFINKEITPAEKDQLLRFDDAQHQA